MKNVFNPYEYVPSFRTPHFLASPSNLAAHMPDTKDIKPPFLPPKSEDSKSYTLVLDLDETLGHYDP